jgi:2,4-dienoyl-CoA reductase-like NADH-dependent reductase (Old Yellow Enzyme family)
MLFHSLSIKKLILKNRIVMPPQYNYMSDRAGFVRGKYIHV